MYLLHVLVDHLKSEVLFVDEVVVKGALRPMGSLEENLDSQTVISMLQKHGQTHIQEPLLGWVYNQPFTFSIMWSMTRLCSCWGLNMMISASSSTLTLWPGGQ